MANYIQYSTATSGLVTFDSVGGDLQLVQEAALATTLTLALSTTPVDGQKCSFMSVGGVTALTMMVSTGTIVGTISSVVAGGSFTMLYRATTSKWYKVA